VAEFGEVYGSNGGKLQLKEVTESSIKEEKVWQGVQELKSWEWVYGQTPEFTNLLQGEVSKGRLVSS
jgi:lipoate-protein ligase A